jgi:hypothetical protein
MPGTATPAESNVTICREKTQMAGNRGDFALSNRFQKTRKGDEMTETVLGSAQDSGSITPT